MTERIDAKDYAKVAKKKAWSNAQRITTDIGVFASKGEYARWLELKLLQIGGEVQHLARQVAFDIRVNGVFIKKYTADFTYYDKKLGQFVIEDFKGRKLREWKITKKLLEAVYPQWAVVESRAKR